MTLLARLVVRGGVNVSKRDTPIGVPIISPATTLISPSQIEEGSTTPVTGSIAVTNGGSDSLSGLGVSAVTYVQGSGWLTPTWDGGNTEADWSIDPTGLTEGSYNATFDITASNAASVTISVAVEIYAVTPGTYAAPLYSYPAWLTYSSATDKFSGGPFTSVNPDTYFTGTTRNAGSTQAAFASALAASTGDGDILEIDAGTTIDISSVQTVPGKASGWLLIRSTGYASLPAEGTRIDPTTHAAALATLRATGTNSILRLSQGYIGVYFQGIIFAKSAAAGNSGAPLVNLVAATQTQLSHVPTHVEMRHCVVTNPWAQGGPYSRHGITVQCRYFKIKDSYLDGHSEPNSDSQAINFLSTPGDFEIHNCFLEGSTENIIMGGGASSIGSDGHISNGWVHQNHIFKRLSWQTGGADATYATKKNFIEMKCGQKVVWEGNVCENFDGSGQQFDINLGSKPQSSSEQSWAYVKDILVRYHTFTNSAAPMDLLCTTSDPPGSYFVPDGTQRIEVAHNLWPDSGYANQSDRPLFVASKGLPYITVHHNTMKVTNSVMTLSPNQSSGLQHDFSFRDNINYTQPSYGPILQDGGASNATALDNACGAGQWTCANNIVVNKSWGATLLGAPNNNYNAATLAAIGFTDSANGDFSLAGGSTYKGVGTNGTDPGIDATRHSAITAGVTTGTPTEVYS